MKKNKVHPTIFLPDCELVRAISREILPRPLPKKGCNKDYVEAWEAWRAASAALTILSNQLGKMQRLIYPSEREE